MKDPARRAQGGRHALRRDQVGRRASLAGAYPEGAGQIDILVNNAGMDLAPGMPFTNNSEEDWDKTYAVNLKSVFLMCKAITPYFIEKRA